MADVNIDLPKDFMQLLQLIRQHVQIADVPGIWHPDCLPEPMNSYSPTDLVRIASDIRKLTGMAVRGSLPGADVFPNEDDITMVELLLRGQQGTPYEGGFFHFSARAPPQYPSIPPRVVLRTTDSGRVRFNPNYYNNGCVCLSILGTYDGEPWMPTFTLMNVVHAMQYQFNQMPWSNEPGFQQDMHEAFQMLYNDYLAHETLRAAVCDQLDPATSQLPLAMRQRAARHFVADYDKYTTRCASLSARLDGKPMMNPYRMDIRNVRFNFAGILRRLRALQETAQRDAKQDVLDDQDVLDEQNVDAEQQDVRAEQQDVHAEQQNVDAEQQDVHAEQQDVRAEQQDAHAEQQDVRAEQRDVHSEQQDVRAEQQDVHAEQQDVRAEQQDVHAEQQDVRAEQQDVHAEQQDVHDRDGQTEDSATVE